MATSVTYMPKKGKKKLTTEDMDLRARDDSVANTDSEDDEKPSQG